MSLALYRYFFYCKHISGTTMWKKEVAILMQQKRTKQTCFILFLIAISYAILLTWCSTTQSMALLAYTYTTGFNFLSLITCLVSNWIEKQKPSPVFNFGYERFEVLSVFSSTVLAQLASVFIIKESVERLILYQPEIHTGRLLVGAGLGLFSHILSVYAIQNPVMDHVYAASSSSWLQEHMTDISQSICSSVPVLSSLLLPRVNPILLIACSGASSLFVTYLLVEMRNYHMSDTFAAILIALMMCATMLPMSIYTGKVLLQTTPSHIVGQLDKCLRESLTIDGVLEFRNEHFWTLSFGKMAGSLQVRVRRDADEQLVLAHIVDKLSNVVSEITVQVFKDEWALRNISTPLHVPVTSTQFVNSLSGVNVRESETKVSNGFPVTSNMRISSSVSNLSSETLLEAGLPLSHKLQAGGNSVSMNSLQEIPLQHSMGNSPVQRQSDVWYQPHKQTFVELNRPTVQHNFPSFVTSTNGRSNNLLLTGTKTLDPNKFSYHPR